MLGQKLKKLRESSGLLQREVAASINLDTAYISKIEHNEKPANRTHIKKFSKLFSIDEKELIQLWLADKIIQVLDNEPYKKEAINLVLKELQNDKK